jgi:cyclophilin family peptidyl-prolyl cis-trans isomerase
MKRTLFVSSLMAVALLGAGCSQAPANDAYVPPAPADTAPAAAPDNTPDVTPSSTPVSIPTPSSTSTMSTLAFPGVLPEAQTNKKVMIKTNLGNIEIQVDPKAGPNAASNFVYLVKQGFYNGTIFHRVIPGFMIQGGDPTGTGTGGPGYQFANDTVNAKYDKGIVAMANAGPDTNGSQFFIMVASVPLGPDYSIFGHVISGQAVADKIAAQNRDGNDRPLSEIKMIDVSLE